LVEESNSPQIVARLTTSFDAQWQGAPPEREKDIVAGTSVSLSAGVAQFDMTGGAAVVVEGPSEFVLKGPNELTLAHGKAAIRADGGKFVIDTPTMQVIDLGTEFGVESAKSGAAQVMVFDGVVALANRTDDATANTSQLDAGFQVSIDENQTLSDVGPPELLANPRYFL